MSGKKQPTRRAKQTGSVEEVLVTVLDELRRLKEQVQVTTDNNSASNDVQPTVEAMESTSQEKPQPCSDLPTNYMPNSMLGQGNATMWTIGNNPIVVASPSKPVPSSSLPLVDMIPDNLRKDILRGKNINLAQLLLPARERGVFMGARDIKIGEETLTLKPMKDNRLTRHLTIQEFIKAFNMLKNVICQQFSHRREELDKYMSHMIEISSKYHGFAFYDYHLEFAARAAYYFEHQQIMIDWGSLDDRLLTQVVSGRKANTCALCQSFDHVTTFCHLAAADQPKTRTTDDICFQFNSLSGCPRKGLCKYSHLCKKCKSSGHTLQQCKSNST